MYFFENQIPSNVKFCTFYPLADIAGGGATPNLFLSFPPRSPCPFPVSLYPFPLQNTFLPPSSSLPHCSVSSPSGVRLGAWSPAWICQCFYPGKIRGVMGEISESIFRQITYASATCFRFLMRYFVLKPECFKRDPVENRDQISHFLTPPPAVKLRERWARYMSEFYQFGIGTNL